MWEKSSSQRVVARSCSALSSSVACAKQRANAQISRSAAWRWMVMARIPSRNIRKGMLLHAILRLFFCMYGGAKEQERILLDLQLHRLRFLERCLLYTSPSPRDR